MTHSRVRVHKMRTKAPSPGDRGSNHSLFCPGRIMLVRTVPWTVGILEFGKPVQVEHKFLIHLAVLYVAFLGLPKLEP